jgi:signal transduction histidine kinase
MLRRLYLQIYLTIIGILVMFAILAAIVWRAGNVTHFDDTFEMVTEYASTVLPPAQAPVSEQREAIERMHQRLGVDLALYAADGRPIAASGRPLPPVDVRRAEPGFFPGRGGPALLLRLHDGRWLAARQPREGPRPGAWVIASLVVMGLAVALGAWPIARRLTRRLERLKGGVEQLGSGDLSARVKVEGKDEIATLAESFNRSAARIEELVRAHKMLLANASHELRTPLTRINMALALIGDADPQRRDQLKADIAELDQLIEELLLASRLDAIAAPERSEEIDLLALAAEEAARYGLDVEGETALVRGDPTLLRRMIRNLIENARRHGGDAAPEVRVQRTENEARLTVRDHGPGVPESEREKIFAPFYRLAGSAETGKGSGLGLALVRQIARHHGGDVTCSAAEGGGSRFGVMLPITARAGVAADVKTR